MTLEPVQAMADRRRRDTQMMKLMRALLLLPTYLIFLPLMRLLDALGYSGWILRKMNASLKEKFQIHQSFDGYEPTEHDVIVSCYFKSGTNWTMQITHQIANLGEGEFEHVHDVIPWPDGMPNYSLDVQETAVYQAAPTKLRVIKSHLPLDYIPYSEKAKYICVVRDPKDMFVSGYHFTKATMMGPLMPSVAAYVELMFSEDLLFGSWAHHTHSFWQARQRENVLFLTFREMKENSHQTIQQIAQFMGVTLDEAALARVIEKSSFAYMKTIDHKFFPGQTTPWSQPDGKMMRKGKVGDADSLLTAVQQRQIDAHFRQELAELGSDFPYDALYGAATPSPKVVSAL